ncbi:MAG TPA: phosphoribosylformylglycinamidine synthase subunit PurQ [bacterium]|nr:phosphoribosylformylglycinamidine synthase subunit PurQ [bacterium]
MRAGVVVFPGSNCDRDCVHVLRGVLGQDVVEVWHGETALEGLDAVILPGGFAYGDYLRAGAVAATSPIMRAVRAFAQAGGPVLGICNGFQVLLEAGLLPGAMLRNHALQFRCKPVHIRAESTRTPFTRALREGQVLRLPIAHGEGNYYAPPALLATIQDSDQVVFRYCDPDGRVVPEANPNGSLNSIAGVCSPGGNVLGLMPHPERASEAIFDSEDGRLIFESLIAFVESRRPVPVG